MRKYPFTKQESLKDCGAAAISMIVKYYHGYISVIKLRNMLKINQNGTTAYHILNTLKSLGFKAECNKEPLKNTKVPFIAHTIIKNSFYHFVVIYEVNDNYVIMADPMEGVKKVKILDFKKIWTGIKIEMHPIRNILKERKIKKINIIKVFKFKDIFIKIFPLSLVIIITSVINTFFFAAALENISLGIIFLILILLNIVSNYSFNNHIIDTVSEIIKKIQFKTYKSIINLPYEYLENYKTGEIISYINEIPILEKFYVSFLITFTRTFPLLVLSLITLYIINKNILILIIVVNILYFLISKFYTKKLKVLIEKNQIIGAELYAFRQETISNYNTIKGINIENKIIKIFSSVLYKATSINKRLSKLINREYLCKNLILDITKALITIYGIYLYNKHLLYLNALITIVMLVNLTQDSLKMLFDLNINFKEALQTFIKLEELNFIKNDGSYLPKIKQIEIKNLSYSFDELTNILKNINLKINAGEKILVTGKSGGGKSTLFKILKGFYSHNGEILINGKRVKNAKLKMLYISGKSAIFSGTINQNITIKSSSDVDIIKEICYINEIIENKELGSYTLIEEDGNNISDGQRQRISLARALYNFDILVIDEALNATDINLERKILKKLLKYYSNKIIIFITHRLDNLDLFERYIKIDNGKIILDKKYKKN